MTARQQILHHVTGFKVSSSLHTSCMGCQDRCMQGCACVMRALVHYRLGDAAGPGLARPTSNEYLKRMLGYNNDPFGRIVCASPISIDRLRCLYSNIQGSGWIEGKNGIGFQTQRHHCCGHEYCSRILFQSTYPLPCLVVYERIPCSTRDDAKPHT